MYIICFNIHWLPHLGRSDKQPDSWETGSLPGSHHSWHLFCQWMLQWEHWRNWPTILRLCATTTTTTLDPGQTIVSPFFLPPCQSTRSPGLRVRVMLARNNNGNTRTSFILMEWRDISAGYQRAGRLFSVKYLCSVICRSAGVWLSLLSITSSKLANSLEKIASIETQGDNYTTKISIRNRKSCINLKVCIKLYKDRASSYRPSPQPAPPSGPGWTGVFSPLNHKLL